MDNNDTQKLSHTLEALLFWRGEAVTIKDLAKDTETDEERVHAALTELEESLSMRGIRLVRDGERVALATAPEVHTLIEKLRKEELEGPLGRAGLVTLAIIIYHGPLSRADIEYIRGVNSASILRSLTMRGLIEKIENPENKRSVHYRPTPELPATLGVTQLSELPNFESVRASVAAILEERDTETGEASEKKEGSEHG